MGTVAIVIIIVVVLLAIAGGAALVLARRRRQQQLVEQFGPEYERRVAETGDRKQAEQELQQRKDRHDQHQLQPLNPADRERFHADWTEVQRSFVDDPGGAVEHADALLVTIMRQRGYPVEGGQRRTDDLSVAQPHLVQDYRRAQDVVTAHRQGTASTEDLRYAFTSYRTLVEAMLDDEGQGHGGNGQHGGDHGADHRADRPSDHGAGIDGSTERIPGTPRGGGDQQIGHPNAGTERIQPPPGGGAPGPGGPPAGAPGQGAPQGGPAGPGRPPTAPPATGGPDGYQERRP